MEFPVDLVSPDGVPWQAHTPIELNDLVYGCGYRLRRANSEMDGVAVAQPVRAASPREVTVRRQPAGAEPDAPPADLAAETAPSSDRARSRSRRPGKA